MGTILEPRRTYLGSKCSSRFPRGPTKGSLMRTRTWAKEATGAAPFLKVVAYHAADTLEAKPCIAMVSFYEPHYLKIFSKIKI